jgi:hypothetical protein
MCEVYPARRKSATAIVVASLKAGNHPETTLGRAIGSIWIALGISIFCSF